MSFTNALSIEENKENNNNNSCFSGQSAHVFSHEGPNGNTVSYYLNEGNKYEALTDITGYLMQNKDALEYNKFFAKVLKKKSMQSRHYNVTYNNIETVVCTPDIETILSVLNQDHTDGDDSGE